MQRKREWQGTRARDLLNARTCSLRCELVAVARLAQEISAAHLKRCCSRAPAGRVLHGAQRRTYKRLKIDCPSFGKRLFWRPYRRLHADDFSAFPAPLLRQSIFPHARIVTKPFGGTEMPLDDLDDIGTELERNAEKAVLKARSRVMALE